MVLEVYHRDLGSAEECRGTRTEYVVVEDSMVVVGGSSCTQLWDLSIEYFGLGE